MPRMLANLLLKIYGLKRFLLYPRFFRDWFYFRSLAGKAPRLAVGWKDLLPIIGEATAQTGFDRHYIYHTAWAARVLAAARPAFHVDISSSLYFCALVSAFVPVRFYDFRPAPLALSGLTCGQADVSKLPFKDNEIESLSCMHVIEHVGLGRYGDKLDYDGDLKAISELKRVLAPGGVLLFVAPIGKPKIMFNAHRIYSYEQVKEYFKELELKEFALIPRAGDGELVINPPKALADSQDYGCGCFWFVKPIVIPTESGSIAGV
ncbi:DUF268 domain-containing protein [Patescibacteria group bacterium]|nr:MAG: DUF268 domain-containing protein [Patescibacteria group bacterium]